VVLWESLSESEREQWSKKMGKTKDLVIWCRSRKKYEEQHPFEVWKINLLKPQRASKSQSRGEDRSERRQKAVGALESMVATEQHQMRSERRPLDQKRLKMVLEPRGVCFKL